MKASSAPPPELISDTPAVPQSRGDAEDRRWPNWHANADILSGLLLVVAAFLAASFAARNSDLWLHLASGRLVAAFDYPWGSDPFSFTNVSRPWVNYSWLFDLGLYVTHELDETGGAAVLLKALTFTAAFGLPLLLKKSRHSLWPWVVFASLAVLTSAPYAVLGPIVGSMFFLSLTLFLIYRSPWGERKWLVPGRVAVLFAVWANVDAWHILGPLTISLLLIGELIQNRFVQTSTTPSHDDPLPPSPPVAGLARALLLGTIACTLNPTFLVGVVKDPADAVGQVIPSELAWGLPAEIADDPELAPLAFTPLSPGFTDAVTHGNNLNGLATLLLIVGGAIALAADYQRIRIAHVLIWITFLVLALQSCRLLPFLAVVTLPLAATHLNSLSARIPLRGHADPRTRILLTLSGVGRILTVPAIAVMAVAAWPGWLHPPAEDPALSRRAEWAVIPDPGPRRVTEVVAKWRADGELNDVRGMFAAPELGDYATWFAPGSQTFIDSRIGFHRNVLPDLLRLRRELGLVRRPGDPEPDPSAVREIVLSYDTKYIIVPASSRGAGLVRDEQKERFLAAFAALLFTSNEWRLWHLDGRSAVVGRADTSGAEKLRFDPVRLAFGPDVSLVSKGSATPATTTRNNADWTEALKQLFAPIIERPSPLPPEVDDATVYDQYGRARLERIARHWQVTSSQRLIARAAVAGIGPVFIVGAEAPPGDDIQHAYPLLALRAARQAVAKCPDRAEPYRVLAWAYDTPGLATFQSLSLPIVGPRLASPERPPVGLQYSAPGDRPGQLITALVRALARIPNPSEVTADQALLGLTWNLQLAELYFRPPPRQLPREQFDEYMRSQQLDLAREALQSANAYAQVAAKTPELIGRIIPPGVKDNDPVPAFLKELGEREAKLTDLIVPRNDAVDQRTGVDKPVERFLFAAAVGLPGKAIDAFKEVKNPNDFGGADQHLAAAVQMIELELRAGRVEEAAADVDVLNEAVGFGNKSGASTAASDAVRYLKFRIEHLVGNYEAAGEAWVELFAGRLPQLQPDLRAAAVGVRADEVNAAGALGGGVGQVAHLEWASARSEQASRVLSVEAGFHYNRAVLALQEGNIPEATTQFESALRPQGLELTALGDDDTAKQINTYLQLIRKAGRK